jgi:hypothetical protein
MILQSNTCVFTVPSVSLTNAGVYDVATTNIAGATQPTLSAKTIATVVAPPGDQTAPPGSNVLLRAIIGQPPNYTNRFQWWFNGTAILAGSNVTAGAVLFFTNDLRITNLSPTTAGSYTFAISNLVTATNTVVTTNPPATNYVVVTNLVGPPAAFTAVVQLASADTDGDGMADDWETQYGLDPNNPGDANMDSDGDGLLNWQEYVTGTNPRDSSSVLRLTVASEGAGAAAAWSFSFTAMSNKTYSVEMREVLGGSSWSNWMSFDAAPTNRLISVTNPIPAEVLQRFLRVRTPKAP